MLPERSRGRPGRPATEREARRGGRRSTHGGREPAGDHRGRQEQERHRDESRQVIRLI